MRTRKKSPALPCGEVDEPAKAGGTAVTAALQASSQQRHAHRATSRLAWVKRWLKRASENHHAQSRSSRILPCDQAGGSSSAVTGSDSTATCARALVDEPLELAWRARVELAVDGCDVADRARRNSSSAMFRAASTARPSMSLVGRRVGGRRASSGRHTPPARRRIARIERAADRVALPVRFRR